MTHVLCHGWNAAQTPSIPNSLVFPSSKWYVLSLPGLLNPPYKLCSSFLSKLFYVSYQITLGRVEELCLCYDGVLYHKHLFLKMSNLLLKPKIFFLLDTLSEALLKKTGYQYLDIASPTSPLYLWKQGKEVKWFAQGLNYLLANVG